MPEVSEHKKGVFYAIICYLAWGFYPLYWKLLQHVPAVEILCHRLFWSMVSMPSTISTSVLILAALLAR